MGLGYVEGVTHDYVRHGTTTLFAALDNRDGRGIHRMQAPPTGTRSFSPSSAALDAAIPQQTRRTPSS